MKGYTILAGRYLKQQRRRSVLTVLGIVLSVALITALLTMGQALRDNMIQHEIRQNGSYHFQYYYSAEGLYDKLRNHALVDRVGVVSGGSQTKFGDDSYSLYVKEINRDARELLPLHLTEGSLPASPDEVAIEEWALLRLPGKPQLSGTVTLNSPDGEPHVYKVVGVLRNDRFSQTNRASTAYTLFPDTGPKPGPKNRAQLFVTLKEGVDISARLPEFEKMAVQAPEIGENGGNPFGTNHQLLAIMGEAGDSGLNRALVTIFGTLVGLVVLSTVAVIYNAFHISVLERIRQFGLLRTIGATPRQIRSLVFKEASTLALIGIPLGLAIGWGGLWLVLWLMVQGGFRVLQMDDFHLTFHWWVMGVSVGVGLAAVYLAAWLPARKASRVSPVDAVKGAGNIVRESYRRVRIPSLLRALGIEGKMASNNIRRNRTKFRITTFSIVVSITLFIVFHYFTQQSFQMLIDTTENNKIAFELQRGVIRADENGTGVQDIVTSETMKRIAGIPGVEQAYGRYMLPAAFAITHHALLNPDFIRVTGLEFESFTWKGEPAQAVFVDLQLYDEARFSKAPQHLISGTADPAKLDAEGGVLLVQTVKPTNQEQKKKEILPLTRYKVGDTITLQMGDDTDEESTTRQVKVSGILSQSPFDTEYMPNSLVVIGTKKVMKGLLEAASADKKPFGTALMGVQVALEDDTDPEPVLEVLETIALENPGVQLINIMESQKEQRQFAVQMKIFVYGFLAVIGLIGSLNIINTVQTNLLLRRREIGLLQAVGMTMGQIRKMATAEGVWFGVIGSVWGLLLGGGLSYFLFRQLSGLEGIPFEFPWGGAVIACAFALSVGLLSVQGPLRRMAKANLIEELREDA